MILVVTVPWKRRLSRIAWGKETWSGQHPGIGGSVKIRTYLEKVSVHPALVVLGRWQKTPIQILCSNEKLNSSLFLAVDFQ